MHSLVKFVLLVIYVHIFFWPFLSGFLQTQVVCLKRENSMQQEDRCVFQPSADGNLEIVFPRKYFVLWGSVMLLLSLAYIGWMVYCWTHHITVTQSNFYALGGAIVAFLMAPCVAFGRSKVVLSAQKVHRFLELFGHRILESQSAFADIEEIQQQGKGSLKICQHDGSFWIIEGFPCDADQQLFIDELQQRIEAADSGAV